MNQLQIFNHEEFGNVRVLGDFNNPLFCLADVCRILELPQVAKVVQRLDKDVLSTHPLETAGGIQQMYFINEDGLYDVILDSRKPNAKRFRKWLTVEVVPSIRKTGMYIDPNAPIDTQLLRQLADEIDRQRNKVAVLETQVAQLQPKASYCDLILQCPDLVSTSQIAKDYGFSGKTFNKILHNLKVEFKQGGVWLLYQKYARLGWTSTKTYHFTDIAGQEHCRVHTYWTQKGRLGLYELLKQNGYLPTIERAA